MTAAAAQLLEAHGRAPAFLAVAASMVLHAALFAAILSVRPAPERRAEPIAVDIVETRPAASIPPAPDVQQAAPASVPRRMVRPPRIAAAPPVAHDAAPARPDPAPPPPSAAAPESSKPGPIRIGVSMSSTTSAGTYAAPVGNTAYGKPPQQGRDPSQVKPYRSDRYAAPSDVSMLPVPVQVELPKSEYPPDALREGFEGAVKLRLVVDEEGKVREATVISDPGHGLGAAAARAAKRWFRFRPALKGGAPVATEIPFTVEFQLQ